jgi:RNA polymerase sigma factor (sigma-70 family)
VLRQADSRLAQVAQMRYFGGYSVQELAETLEVTERTVRRDWEKARVILKEALKVSAGSVSLNFALTP